MKKKLLSLFAFALTGGATAMATTLSDLTATNVDATYSIAGDFYTQETPSTTDGGGWTVTYTGSGWGNAANNNLWFWACSAVNVSKTVELPAGTYIMHTTIPLLNGGRCAFAAFAGSTATFSSSDGYADASALGATSADATQSNVNLYVPFYVSAQGDVTMAYNVIWGSKEFQISKFTLYTVKEGDTAGDYTSLLLTQNNMKSVIDGLSEEYMALQTTYNEVSSFVTAATIGTGYFQYPSTPTALNTLLSEANTMLENNSSTNSEYTSKASAITTALNTFKGTKRVPTSGNYYYLMMNDMYFNLSWDANNYAVLSTLPFAVILEEADAENDQYYIKNTAGEYLGSGGNAYLLAKGDKIVFTFSSGSSDNEVKIVAANASSGRYVGHDKATPNNGQGLSNQNTAYTTWTMTDASEESVTINITSAKWSTFVAPFSVTIPSGVEAYTVTATASALSTTPVETTIPANTPVLLYSSSIISQDVTGYAQHPYAGTVTVDALTGVYTNANLPENSYVLQKQGDVVGFYNIGTAVVAGTPNRAYLTVPANARQFIPLFEGETTAIDAVTKDNGAAEVYSLSGIRTRQTAKGLNIVRTADGQVKMILR